MPKRGDVGFMVGIELHVDCRVVDKDRTFWEDWFRPTLMMFWFRDARAVLSLPTKSIDLAYIEIHA